jgi:hypothetical protein
MKVKDERKELESLIENSPDKIDSNVPTPGKTPELQVEPIMDANFAEIKDSCEKDARVMINNAISFIIPADMINENLYIKNKLEVDIISLAGLIYQLRTNEVMQKALIDLVNSGMINPRMFEVFGQLSKVIGELNKQLIQTVEALKESYKMFKNDVKEQRTEALGPQANSTGMITTGDGGIVTRGTKELINNVKRLKNQVKDTSTNYLDDSQLILDLPII